MDSLASRTLLVSRTFALAIVAGFVVSLSGCNAGLGALISGLSGGGGSGGNQAPSSVSAFTVVNTKTSPAQIRFVLIDANSDDVELELLYELPDGSSHTISSLGGAPNPGTYSSSPGGSSHEVSWDFPAEVGFDPSGAFVAGVTVFGRILNTEGPPTAIVAGATAAIDIGLGNDAPVIDAIATPQDEIAGVVPVAITISDSSSDLVSLRVEYEIPGGAGWALARPAGMSETPELAVVGLSAPAGGVEVSFFWDATVDLPLAEEDIRLRVTPSDGVVDGAPVLSELFRIDNNSPPILFLDNGLIALSAEDVTGGVAVPLNVVDPEGDGVRIVLQWRRPGQTFPTLPTDDPAAVFAIQDDPQQRAQYQVCSPRVRYMTGRPEFIDPLHLRLPTLGTSAVPVATPEFVGRKLDLLRPANLPIEVTAAWSANPFSSLVGVVPIGDGLEALTLEGAAGSWTVRRVDLATGALSDFVAGSGSPASLAVDLKERFLFVAYASGGSWNVDRVELSNGAVLATASGPFIGPIADFGIAALSPVRVAVTVDDTLREVCFDPNGGAFVRTARSGLVDPRGVVADPLCPDAVIVAEAGADRVVSVNILTGTASDVLPGALRQGTSTHFPTPRAVAFDQGGKRLLVVVEPRAGSFELRAWTRDVAHDLDGDGSGDPTVYTLSDLPQTPSSLASGHAGLRLLADSTSGAIVAIGGVEQRRTIVDAPATTNVVTLDAPLEPSQATRWRVSRATNTFSAPPGGADHVFPWDTSDLKRGGPVLVRGLPFDSELGVGSQTSVERQTVSEIDGERVVVDDLSAISDPEDPIDRLFPTVVDFDQDGDLDIVIGTEAAARLILQTGPGVFAAPVSIDLPLEEDSLGVPLLVEDLDGDGAVEIVQIRSDGAVQIFRGTGPGTFDRSPEVLPAQFDGARYRFASLTTGDMNGDGAADLIVTEPTRGLHQFQTPDSLFAENPESNAILIYHQGPTGAFDMPPKYVGGHGVTNGAYHVVTGDVDGDGFVDIVTACTEERTPAGFPSSALLPREGGSIVVHFQNAAGEFPDFVHVGEPDSGDRLNTAAARAVALADLDFDGDLDLILGNGPFTSSAGPTAVPSLNHKTTVHFQTAARVFDPVSIELEGPGEDVISRTTSVTAVDLDGDGLLDIATQGSHGIHVFFATSPGVFDPTPLTIEFEAERSEEFELFGPNDNLEIVDIDGDGDLDFVVNDTDSNTIEVVFSHLRGVPTFSQSPLNVSITGVTDGANAAVVSDLNADGKLDFATSNGNAFGLFGANDFQLFFQTTPRTFTSTPLLLSDGGPPTVPIYIEAADVDQDGDRDLIGVGQQAFDCMAGTCLRGGSVQVFLQESPGSFAPPQVFWGPETYSLNTLHNTLASLFVADYDRDGVIEIATSPSWHAVVVGIDSTVPGQLEQSVLADMFSDPPPMHSLVGPKPRSFAAIDWDEDGDVELLMGALGFTATSSEILYVLDAPGSQGAPFSETPTEFLDMGSMALLDADIDGDGRVDLVAQTTAGGGGSVATLHLRNSMGGFDTQLFDTVPVYRAATQSQPPAMRLVDLDADGDLDIAMLQGAGFAGGAPMYIEQLAPGVFTPVARPLTPGSGVTGASLSIEDIDGDGELDVLVPYYGFGPVATHGTRIAWGGE